MTGQHARLSLQYIQNLLARAGRPAAAGPLIAFMLCSWAGPVAVHYQSLMLMLQNGPPGQPLTQHGPRPRQGLTKDLQEGKPQTQKRRLKIKAPTKDHVVAFRCGRCAGESVTGKLRTCVNKSGRKNETKSGLELNVVFLENPG